MPGFASTAQINIDASPDRIWHLLTQRGPDPDIMLGAEVISDWTVGSPIVWRGEFEGRSYEDKGVIVEYDDPRRLVVTHFSPMSGDEDAPDNYHRLTYTLSEGDAATHVSLEQDNNKTPEAAEHSAKNWQIALNGLKRAAER